MVVNKINKNYTDFEFKFKKLKEAQGIQMAAGADVWIGVNSSIYTERLNSNNRLEVLNGLSLHAVYDDLGTNAIIVSPGSCDVSNPITGDSKVHFMFETSVVEYKTENMLDDGSTIIQDSGFLYLYALFNDSNDTLLFRFSNVEPTRTKNNQIPPAHAGLTLYHPTLPARCIGFLPVGQYHRSGWSAGKFPAALIADNKLSFTYGSTVYEGNYDKTWNFSNYNTPPTSVGGFPKICTAVSIVLWGSCIVETVTTTDPNLTHTGTIISESNKSFNQAYYGAVAYSNGNQCVLYLHRAKDLIFYPHPDVSSYYGLGIYYIEIAR